MAAPATENIRAGILTEQTQPIYALTSDGTKAVEIDLPIDSVSESDSASDEETMNPRKQKFRSVKGYKETRERALAKATNDNKASDLPNNQRAISISDEDDKALDSTNAERAKTKTTKRAKTKTEGTRAAEKKDAMTVGKRKKGSKAVSNEGKTTVAKAKGRKGRQGKKAASIRSSRTLRSVIAASEDTV